MQQVSAQNQDEYAQSLESMGSPIKNLGLTFATPEDVLKANSLSTFPAFISPIESVEDLKKLIEQVITLVPQQGEAQVFSVHDPVRHAQIHHRLADLRQEESFQTLLTFPVSLYVNVPSAGHLQPLVDIVAKLRDPQDGCPWDLEQTPQSLTRYILEEAYEAVEAIQEENTEAIVDELGDLLLQVILQAQLAHEQNQFSLQEVGQGIAEKLIRRHPHVFGETDAKTVQDVRKNWEAIKAQEKGRSPDDRELVSEQMQQKAKTFPPIIAGLKLSKLAADAGLEWPDLASVWAKFYEELAEFQEALLVGQPQDQLAELGDLFFTLINVARWCSLDPGEALQLTNRKLIQRIQFIERKVDKPLTDYSLKELDDLWNHAKLELQADEDQSYQTELALEQFADTSS